MHLRFPPSLKLKIVLRAYSKNIFSEIEGGSSQPEISDPRDTVQKMYRLGKENEKFVNHGV